MERARAPAAVLARTFPAWVPERRPGNWQRWRSVRRRERLFITSIRLATARSIFTGSSTSRGRTTGRKVMRFPNDSPCSSPRRLTGQTTRRTRPSTSSMQLDVARDRPNYYAQDAIVDFASQGGANRLYLAQIDFRPAELAVSGTRFVEVEPLGRLQPFRQQGCEFLQGVLPALAEQPLGQVEQTRLGSHRILQGALNSTADLLGEGMSGPRGNRPAGSPLAYDQGALPLLDRA